MKGDWHKKMMCVLLAITFILPAYAKGENERKPDLLIEIVGYTPLNPVEGEMVTIIAKVSNIGDLNAVNFNVQFSYDSINFTIGNKPIKFLAANATAEISITWKAIKGNHTIIAIADVDDVVKEENEVNNVGKITIFVDANKTGTKRDFLNIEAAGSSTSSAIKEGGSIIGEVGKINGVDENWKTVYLINSYNNPVVIAEPLSANDIEPCTVRIKDVTSNSFKIRAEEWKYLDGNHGLETVHYIVMEAGVHTLPDGTKIEAGTVVTDENWVSVTFTQSFSSKPVTLTQCQTRNGGDPVVTRVKDLTESGFKVRLQEEEAEGPHTYETIGYIAIEPGTGINNNNKYEIGRTGNVVTSGWYRIYFSQSFSKAPIFIAWTETFNGGDTIGVRYKDLSSGSVKVCCEEEQSKDWETWHTREVVGYFAFENAGSIVGVGPDIDYYSCYIYDEGIDEDLIGNDNGAINAGEFVKLKIYLRNSGNADAHGVYANLSVDDDKITITNSYEEYGNIPAGQTKACYGNFSLIVDGDHSQGYVTFTLDIYDADGNHWTRNFNLHIGPPIPFLVYFDSTVHAGDNIASPGETVTLDVEIFNSGSRYATGVEAELSTDDPFVTISDNYESYGIIFANSTKEKSNAFTFHISSSHPSPSIINFTLYINDSDGNHFINHFEILILPADIQVIKIAMIHGILYTTFPKHFGYWGEHNVRNALHGYYWEANGNTYIFDVDVVSVYKIILKGLNGYDVLLIPGIARHYALTGWKLTTFKNKVQNFILNGGGYVGICGGAVAASLGLYENESLSTTTLWETNMDRTALGIINAKVIQDFADPYCDPFEVGQAAYLFYNHNDQKAWGACLNISIDNTHPIFQGYNKDYRIIRWGGGPAFHIEGGGVDVLAWYPDDALSSTLHIWKYDRSGPEFRNFWNYIVWMTHLPGYFTRPYIDGMPDWDPTGEIVKTYIKGKPAIIASEYGEGRIIVSGPHPEFSIVYHSKQLSESGENDANSLGDIYRWKNQGNEIPEYNWWLLRRMVAYVAPNCPDSDLPPIEEAQQIVLTPTDDTFIAHKRPDNNYGSRTNLLVRNDYGSTPGWAYDILIKFDLSSIPQGATIQSAKLRLYYYQHKDNDPAGRKLNCYRITSNWNENTVTWNTQPSYYPNPTTYATVPSSTRRWMEWDVTSDVQKFINGQATNYGWKITDENYWGTIEIPIAYFYSKEYGSYVPQLVIEYT